MAERFEALGSEVWRSLHPSAVEGREAVHSLLLRLWRDRIVLHRGLNREISRETALVDSVDGSIVTVRTSNFDSTRGRELRVNFELDRQQYFFAARIISVEDGVISFEVPDAVYRAERRDRVRTGGRAVDDGESPRWVRLVLGDTRVDAQVLDASPRGLGVELVGPQRLPVGSDVLIEYLDGGVAGSVQVGSIRHSGTPDSPPRVGISLLHSASVLPMQPMPRSSLAWNRTQRALRLLRARAVAASAGLRRSPVATDPDQGSIRIVDFVNESGERIRGIADYEGEMPPIGAPVVLIPPAWGRTKETLLPLAATIVSTMSAARQAVTVVRFDGVRKRGESYKDPECRTPGNEHHRFTFSQGVRDIRSVIRGLREHAEFRASPVVVVSFSAASIDARRAVATLPKGELAGWVSVVGTADLQSMMRVVSGGVDYVGGVERGVRFGLQEILGVEVDIDLAGRDALDNRIAFLEDSCSDMERIEVPVTWIHGQFDAWMDLERVRLILSKGDVSNRRLMIVPTGHRLRSSREAFEVFELVATEIGRMIGVGRIRSKLPDLRMLELRGRAERARLPRSSVNKREFWEKYLLGREGSLGIELMTSTVAYRELMDEQLAELRLAEGARVADIGCGTGAFLEALSRARSVPARVVVFELDYVYAALARARQGFSRGDSSTASAEFVLCNLGGRNGRYPIRDGSFDAVLASLFLSYVDDLGAVLGEIRRILRPEGTLVVSGLRRDADISKLFVESVDEIARGGGAQQIAARRGFDINSSTRDFLNQASRLLELEEEGVFRFMDASELSALIEEAGFKVTRVWTSFGDPPQAAVVAARRSS